MPDTSGLWVAAARHGLGHPVLGQAARILLAVVADHLGSVTAETRHTAFIEEYTARYVHRGLTPGSQTVPRPRDFTEDRIPEVTVR